MKYKVSKYYRSFGSNGLDEGILYHSIFGNATRASTDLINILDEHHRCKRTLTAQKIGIPSGLIAKLINKKILVRTDNYMETIDANVSGSDRRKIRHLRLCVTRNCNMRCKYCYIDCDDIGNFMSCDIARLAIDKYLAILKKSVCSGKITLFGGEPFLNWKCISDALEYIKKEDPGRRYIEHIIITTNGTLLNERNLEFLRQFGVHIAVSLDGPKDVNDSMRKMKNGGGSFDRIVESLNVLKKINYKNISITSIIGDHNINDVESLSELVSKYSSFSTISNAYAEPKEVSFRGSDEEMAEAIIKLCMCMRKLGTSCSGKLLQPVKKALYGNNSLLNCTACGCEISVDPNGTVRPCPGYDGKSGTIYKLDDALNSDNHSKCSRRSVANIPECKGCDIEGLCSGGCMLNAYNVHGGDIFRRADTCGITKLVFNKFMNYMLEVINQRSSSGVSRAAAM